MEEEEEEDKSGKETSLKEARKTMAAKNLTLTLVLASCVSMVVCQDGLSGSISMPSLSSLPGAQTASGVMTAATDGMSRYLAPNGPIQPAITAISGLPMRAGELVNGGMTRISSGLNRGAQRMSQAAGQGGQIRMPGLQRAASYVPSQLGQFGSALQGAIRSKNNFIMGQAQSGVSAADRMGANMRQGLQS